MKISQNERSLDPAKTLSAELADHLCERIRKDRLVPGDRLGTEADLADEFGVSRTVVREAIGSLRGLGIVTGRQGLGLCVAEASNFSSVLRKALVPQVASPQGWRELQQLRAVIEIGSIALAVELISAEEIIRLQTIVVEMKRVMKNYKSDPTATSKTYKEMDCMFHQTILAASHGNFVKQFHGVLLDYFHAGDKHGHPPTTKGLREHEFIANAIADRDIDNATKYLTEHLKPQLKAPCE
ncbi:MAG: FCD domain-containing protein [Planctomycetes bacterium]|nr:FCD domain-containing protein [Planctomycetota bacterium]MCH9723355.1 FCD domain-containing protein [Planctomycetota bacterium]MCH9779070.1 FCD domain-containing protein [Planctomycetota bacterium]MCH9792112.1 FCD domain-containing protein [Planctomycetota bacterium]MDF1745332.1 FCD domain-containing protein [Gimesia sp.]